MSRLVFGISTVALILVLFLTVENRQLRQSVRELRERVSSPYAGLHLPAFHAPALDGDTVGVAPAGEGPGQVLFYFTTSCPYCLASIPAWNRIRRDLQPDGIEVVGISLDSLRLTDLYARRHGLEMPVVHYPDSRTRQLYRSGRVPVTIVVARDGRIAHARIGVLDRPAAIDSILDIARRLRGDAGGSDS